MTPQDMFDACLIALGVVTALAAPLILGAWLWLGVPWGGP